MQQKRNKGLVPAGRILALSLGMALLFAGCGQKEKPATSQMTSQEASVATSSTETKENTKEASLHIMAATDPIYDFAKAIGGDRVAVTDLIEGEADEHHWEPSPQLLTQINDSELFLVSGAGLENWLDDVKASLTDKVKVLDMSEGVKLVKAEEHEDEHEHEHEHEDADASHDEHEEHEHHHHHGIYDPHYWLSPKAAAKQAENVYKAMVAADPAGKETYDANYKKVQAEFDKLNKAYEEKLKPFAGRSVIVPHEAFGYLFGEYQLKQVGLEGMLAEGQPDAKKLAQIVDLAKKEGIKTIFYEAYGDDKEADAIAKEIGAKTAPIYTLEAESKEDRDKGENYFTLMMKNLDAIVASFGGK